MVARGMWIASGMFNRCSTRAARLPWVHRLMQNRSLMLVASVLVFTQARAAETTNSAAVKTIAAIVTVYNHNSHADLIVSRLLQTDTLDGKGNESEEHTLNSSHGYIP